MTVADESKIHPWRIYGKEFEVSESKMGKSDSPKVEKAKWVFGKMPGVASTTVEGVSVPKHRIKDPGEFSGEEGTKEHKSYLQQKYAYHKQQAKEATGKKKYNIHHDQARRASNAHMKHYEAELSPMSGVPSRSAGTSSVSQWAKGNQEEMYSMDKSIQRLKEMAASVSPSPLEEGTELLKACRADMEKGAEGTDKAYLGTLAIPEKPGVKPKFTGEGAVPAGASYGEGALKPGHEKLDEGAWKDIKLGPPKAPKGGSGQVNKSSESCAKCGEDVCKCVDKAITSMSVPRLPRAMQQEMIRRNAQNVMTRGNSRFAGDVSTAPLMGDTTKPVEEENAAVRSGRFEVFKSCGGCGRRYKLFKGMDVGCPSCKINKSTYCVSCGSQLLKSHGGSVRCPLCG